MYLVVGRESDDDAGGGALKRRSLALVMSSALNLSSTEVVCFSVRRSMTAGKYDIVAVQDGWLAGGDS